MVLYVKKKISIKSEEIIKQYICIVFFESICVYIGIPSRRVKSKRNRRLNFFPHERLYNS